MTEQISSHINAATSQYDAAELVEWSRKTIGQVERNEMMIGILPVERAMMVPVALRKALDLGEAEAGIMLADWHVRNPFGEPDFDGAEQALLESIDLGMAQASVPLMQYRWFYRRESAADPQVARAFSLLAQWSAQHPEDSDALYLLALVTGHGFGTEADLTASARLLERAAALGNAHAMFELFLYYANGMGVAQDDGRAIAYLEQAGNAGQVRAMYNLGAFHATGRYVPLDMARAVAWYTKAAYAGHSKAAETLALMYEEGAGVEQDDDMAEKFYAMLDE